MINLYTIASQARAVSGPVSAVVHAAFDPVYQARPAMRLPVITLQGKPPEMLLAHWGCIPKGMHSTLPTYRLDRALGTPPLNRWIRTQRCLIPANCFFVRPADGTVYLVRLLEKRLFYMGGIYCIEEHNAHHLHFLILTTESADVLRPICAEMPVIIPANEGMQWLHGEHMIDLMQMADRSGDYWFDYFQVSSGILTPGVNRRELLKPLGLSVREQSEHNVKLKALDLKQDRYERKGSKR